MSVQRPAVLIYQEYATLSTTPSTPELNVCVVGPCYQLMDFPEDAALQPTLGVYGAATTIGSSLATAAAAPAAAVLTIPAITNGAVVDTASIVVTLPAATVEILAGTATTAVAELLTVAATTGVVVGDTVWVDIAAGSSCLKNTVRAVTGTTIQLNNTLPDALHTHFRVERTLTAPVKVTPSAVSATTVTLPATLTALVGGVAKTVVYGQAFIGYKALRTDLATVNSLGSPAEILSLLGKYDARNPLCVGATVAKANTPSSVQVYGIATNDDAGYGNMLTQTSTRNDIYAVVPLTQSISVLSSFKTAFSNISLPEYALLNGVAQKFRVVIGQPGSLPSTKIISDSRTATGVAAEGTPVIPADNFVITLATYTGTGAATLTNLGIRPGYKILVDLVEYTVASVLTVTADGGTLTVDEALPVTDGTAAVSFKDLTGAIIPASVDATATFTVGAATGVINKLNDSTATFVDAGAIPGDFVEIPLTPSATDFSGALARLKIMAVDSNQTLRVVALRDTSLAMNELPHGRSRVLDGGAVVAADATPVYRIVRALDKDGQVDALIAAGPDSLKDRRAVTVWPDLVDVTDLKDGSASRASLTTLTPSAAGSQPGYYLACQVGGLTAAFPSHQGFTRMGAAGISKLYNSNTYFSDKQITKLSNNGWMVFQQDVPTALPYIIHGLTTDVSALELSEYMMVKNFDYVAISYAEAIRPFIGIWNINPETMGFIGIAIDGVGLALKSDRKPKIGARIKSARTTQLSEHATSKDRLEVKVEIDFPKPLNTIGLHLVSL